MNIRVFIQARMSSRRFPGKVLAPLHGKPIILHVLDKVKDVCEKGQITVLTSDHSSDNPLSVFLESEGYDVYRGELDNVFQRFMNCLDERPCDSFFRICADSPFIHTEVMKKMIVLGHETRYDIITNIYPRSFPKGQSAELLRSRFFRSLENEPLNVDDKEHVTSYIYKHSSRYKIINVLNTDVTSTSKNMVVDTVTDLHHLELSVAV